MKKLRKCLLIITFLIFIGSFDTVVFADNNSDETEDKGVSSVLTIEMKENGEASTDMDVVMDALISDFSNVIQQGLSSLSDVVPTRDYIPLNNWGSFLYEYIGVDINNYKNTDILISVYGVDYVFKDSKYTKEWVFNTLLPELSNVVSGLSKSFPVNTYKIKLEKPVSLQDYTLSTDINNLELLDTYYPFITDSDVDMLVCNIGSSYGLQLNYKYFNVLQGYHGELEYVEKVVSTYPACVDVLVYVTIPKKLGNFGTNNLTLSDVSIHKGLTIDLSTKTLISKTSDSDVETSNLTYSDYGTSMEDLLLLQLDDSVCAVQTKYLESFRWNGWELNTGCIVDLTNYLISGDETVKVADTTNVIGAYTNSSDFIEVVEGKTVPFLIYMQPSSLSMDRIVAWMYSDAYSSRMTTEKRDELIKSMSEAMSKRGRKAEFNSYLKAAGVTPESTKVLIVVVSILVVVVTVTLFVVMYMSKRRKEEKVAGTLFDMSDTDD